MLRLDRRLHLLFLCKEALCRLPDWCLPTAALSREELLALDCERLLRKLLHRLGSQKAQDVHHVVSRAVVCNDSQARPLAEPLRLPPREGSVAVVRPGGVLRGRHVPRPLVIQAQPLDRRFSTQAFERTFAPGHLYRKEGLNVPGKGNRWDSDFAEGHSFRGLGRQVFHGGVVGERVLVVAVLVCVLYGLADDFPGEEGAEALEEGGVVAELEDYVVV